MQTNYVQGPFIAKNSTLVELISMTIAAPHLSRVMKDQDKYLISMLFLSFS